MMMLSNGRRRAMSGVGALALLSLAVLGSPTASYADVNLDFSGTTDFTDNFRVTYNGGLGFSAANETVKVSFASKAAIVYDANGATAGQSVFTVTQGSPLTFSVDFMVGSDTSTLGIYLIDPSHETGSSTSKTSWLALLAVNSNAGGTSATSEYLRIWNDVANPGDTAVGTTLDATVYPDSTNAITTNKWLTATLTYSLNSEGKAVIDYSLAPRGAAATITKQTIWDTPLNTFEIGLRLYNYNMGTTYIDNFSVAQVPEISSLAILGAGSFLVLSRKPK